MCKDLGNNLYECFGNCVNGTIWGTGIYTGDSNPYTAAKQMGMVPGKFVKVAAPALASYVSATVNGITSTAYGNYGSSFILVKYAQPSQIQNPVLDLEKVKLQLIKSYESEMQKYNKTIVNVLSKDKILCSICLHKQRSRVLFPCSHAHFCEDCIKPVREKGQCPICKGSISGDMKIIL